MIGSLIRAAAGRAMARQVGGTAAGPMGAIAGAALPMVLRRFGPLGMIGAVVGGYAVNRYMKNRNRAGVDRTVDRTTASYPGGTHPNLTRP